MNILEIKEIIKNNINKIKNNNRNGLEYIEFKEEECIIEIEFNFSNSSNILNKLKKLKIKLLKNISIIEENGYKIGEYNHNECYRILNKQNDDNDKTYIEEYLIISQTITTNRNKKIIINIEKYIYIENLYKIKLTRLNKLQYYDISVNKFNNISSFNNIVFFINHIKSNLENKKINNKILLSLTSINKKNYKNKEKLLKEIIQKI